MNCLPLTDDPYTLKRSEAEDELWPVMAERAELLIEVPRFSHVVIGAMGKMAVMGTISPASFVEFKRWLAERPNRESAKARAGWVTGADGAGADG